MKGSRGQWDCCKMGGEIMDASVKEETDKEGCDAEDTGVKRGL